MAITYQAGRRLQGVSGDLTNINLTSGTGGWKEVGRTTSGSTITDLDVTGFGDKRYYMVLGNLLHNGSQDVTMRCGQASTLDTGSNYASRRSENGGSDSTSVSRPNMILADIQSSTQSFGVNYFVNKSTKEKLQQGQMIYQGTAGAANAPERTETVNKWTNTSNALDSLSYDQGSWLSGSECVVLGWDDSDTHTTNFWEELASVELGSSSATIASGTITAKKYLWIQAFIPAANHNFNLQFNGDTGSNYAKRRSELGGTDSTSVSQDRMTIGSYGSTSSDFYNIFMVNNSANEKLAIIHNVNRNTAGAGNAPYRSEFVGKWANTSAQITSVNVLQQSGGSGSFDTGSILKVWGSN